MPFQKENTIGFKTRFQKGHSPTTGAFKKGHSCYLKKHSEKTKEKLRISNSGRNNPMYGKHHSKEAKEKISKRMKGAKCPAWKGGRRTQNGYVFIYVPNHPFHNRHNVIQEHRIVVEQQIGRYLKPKERTHHLNGIKNDNRPRNLMAFTSESAHQRFHKNPNNVKPSEIIFDGRKLYA